MKQNKIFKIISSLMVLLTIMSVVNATTISNSLSTFTGIIDMGTQQIYNITNVNTTNIYASVVNTTNLWIGTTKVNASNLLPLACVNNTVGKYDTATGTWLCQTDTDTTYTNGTGLNLTGTTFYLDLNYVDGNYVKRNTWTTIDNYPTGCSAGQYISTIGDTLTCSTPPDINYNVTSLQVTGTTTKTITLEQLGLTNLTATFTDIDTDTDTNTNDNVTAIQFTGTTTKTLTLQQSGGNSNITATFTDTDTDTNANTLCSGTTTYLDGEGNCDDVSSVYYDSEADLTGLLNDNYVDVAGDTMTGRLTMGDNNVSFTQGTGGIVLNQSQSHISISQNSSGCVVIKGASSTLAVC